MENTSAIKDATRYEFEDYFSSRFSRIYFSEELKTVICELKSDYVPIEHFKDTFYKISELVEKGINAKFIFDKRSLRAFHQPSMEWYYIVWKKEMYEKGLSVHRKILPAEAWFRKSVAIAKDQISKENSDLIIPKLDIKYCESIDEALEI
ncbi:MAG: hypothetical protein ACLFUB_02175 [Cyclobacteriaceae bacterium]